MGKIHHETNFNPVIIVLESQEEVDQLYAVLNYVPINKALLEGSPFWKAVLLFLLKCRTRGYEKYHKRIDKQIKLQ